QEAVLVALAESLRLDDEVAETRPGRDRDPRRALACCDGLVLRQELLVVRETRLRLRLARARRQANPFELARERATASRRLLLLLSKPALLLLEPGRAAPF